MLPSHSSPSAVKPSSQVQLKPIIRSTQVAFSAQGLSSRHSLISNGINFVKIIQLKSCTKITLTINIYRPQRSWGKVMFLHVSVILFTGGICLSACWDTTTPGTRHPPPRTRHPPVDQAPPGTRHTPGADTTPLRSACWEIRAVCILLECKSSHELWMSFKYNNELVSEIGFNLTL